MSSNRPTRDLSTRGVPQAWLDAQRESPTGDGSALGAEFHALVERQASHTGTLFLGGLLSVVIAGPLWYLAEATDLADTPWLAAVAGLVIGLIVKLSASAAGSGPRAMLAINSFVIVAIAVAVASAVVDVGEIYGAATTMANYEFHMQARFRNVYRIIAHVAGLGGAAIVARTG